MQIVIFREPSDLIPRLADDMRIIGHTTAVICLLLQGFLAKAQIHNVSESQWVDHIYQQLSLEERIGQLFMIRAHSDLGSDHIASVKRQIEKYHVGGLCFFQGTPDAQAQLTNDYQALATKVPLMISMDAEWGLGMRFKQGVIQYPRQLMLGAIQDNSLIYDFGRETARQLSRIGVHLNFAPVVDINNNAKNPVINFRSFGEDKYNVTTKSYMYMKGMQDHGVAACAKHFPGHGDTDTDSHHELPIIAHELSRLEEIELFPFETLIKHQLASVMVAHLNVPALDEESNVPTTLSKKVIDQYLRKNMGFEGLVFTDALEMQAVAKHYENGMVEVKAIQAGNDILLLPNDIDLAFKTIKEHILTGKISEQRLEKSVRRILHAKYRMGLHNYQPIDLVGIRLDLNEPMALSLKHELIENALTLVRNKEKIVPILEGQSSIASIAIGSDMLSHFQVMINEYQKVPRYLSPHGMKEVDKTKLLEKLGQKKLVLISLHNMSPHASRNFGLTETSISFIKALQHKTKVVLIVFGNPYSLQHFDEIDHVLLCYNDDRLTQNLAAQSLFGALALKGRLPVTASARSKFGSGVETRASFRIGYSVPERVGMHQDSLRKVDALVHELINRKAAPGAQLLVAKDGKVVFQKEYGYQTYQKQKPIQRDHVYDLASVTKTTSTTLAVMKLYEDGKLDLQAPIKTYLPSLAETNKGSMNLTDIMSHHAGLKPWIPFYQKTLFEQNSRPSEDFYRKEKSEAYSVQVCRDLYLRSDFPDSIWQMIIDSELRSNRNYRYSDLGFYIIAKIVKKVSGLTLDRYVRKHFYDPLSMFNTTYNPLSRIPRQRIVPSEKDGYFRFCELRGYVHDMGAAMLDGVGGHAGLFSNASDLVKVYQMLLNKGYYGGTQYLKEETVKKFTTRHPRSTRRAIGFDMKELNASRSPNISRFASEKTYGHFGFTGTAVWVDPTYKLIYIFLCNRTYPSMRNNLLHREEYRSRIQTAIYKAFLPSFVQDQS